MTLEKIENEGIATMIFKPFGKTGKVVSALGLGTMRLHKDNEEQSIAVIQTAIESGINYIDVASNYAGGLAERFVGRAIAGKSELPYIVAKSSSIHEPTAGALRKRLENSLKVLGVSQVAFYCMWSVMSSEQYRQIIGKNGPYEGALRAKSDGLIEHITISCHCDLQTIRQIIEDNCFDGITLSLSITNSVSYAEILELAQRKGVGVATMNTLGGGIIPQNLDYYAKLLEVKREQVVPKALKFVSELPGVSVVLSGMSSVREVYENAHVFKASYSVFTSDTPLCTGCGYCEKEPECPAKLPVSAYMTAYNQTHFLGNCDMAAVASKIFRPVKLVRLRQPPCFSWA
jgi:predicted aldo/keto reductase-like oxidoreductase